MPAVKFFASLDLEQKSSFLDGHYLKFSAGSFSICSGRPAAPSGNFFQYGQNLPLRAPNSAPRTGSKMGVSLSTNRLQLTIYAVRVSVSRPKWLQTVARFEKNDRMTPLVGLTV